jgi:hypothetical protein
MQKPRIFIQVASYRDPELPLTISDAIKNAKYPDRLRFGICWQYGPDEPAHEILGDSTVSVIGIPAMESKGCCWARNLLQQMYGGEEYTLQIDSHHRFAQDWDETLIDMLESLPGRPLLTTYAPSYNPKDGSRIDNPWIMELDNSGEIPMFRPGYSNHTEPKPTMFFSGHFAFARGKHIIDVPYDPELYFHGEEITMAIRSWIAGYDMYHPHKVVIWHEYTRVGRVKQWDEHSEWWKTDQISKDKVRKILSGEIQYIGQRTLEEYKLKAGI